MTSQNYDDLVIQTQARIDALLVTNPGVIERYQKREEEVSADQPTKGEA